jgi:hypothetical protein
MGQTPRSQSAKLIVDDREQLGRCPSVTPSDCLEHTCNFGCGPIGGVLCHRFCVFAGLARIQAYTRFIADSAMLD